MISHLMNDGDGHDTPVKPDQPKELARPKILNGKSMPAFILPIDFDLTTHQKIHASGKAQPVTKQTLISRMIASCDQDKATLDREIKLDPPT